jgi:hypothetical protein
MINKYNMNMIANKVYFKRSNMQRQLLLLDSSIQCLEGFSGELASERAQRVRARARQWFPQYAFAPDDDDDKKRQRQAKINFIFILPRSRPVALVHAINAHHDPSSYIETCKVNNAADKFC